LADAHPRDLAALRHLVTCPLCQELARLILVALPQAETDPARRFRRKR